VINSFKKALGQKKNRSLSYAKSRNYYVLLLVKNDVDQFSVFFAFFYFVDFFSLQYGEIGEHHFQKIFIR